MDSCTMCKSHDSVAKGYCMYLVAPIVTIDPPQPSLTKCVNDSLSLSCTAKGLPVPEILWHKNNTPISQPLPQTYLVPTESPHTTNYTCVATNNAGGKQRQASASIIVMIKGIQHIIMNYNYELLFLSVV